MLLPGWRIAEAFLPITRPTAGVCHGNDLDHGLRFIKHDKVGKAAQHQLSCAECQHWELVWRTAYAFNRRAKLDSKLPRRLGAAPCIPFNRSFRFTRCIRVNPDLFVHLGGNLAQRRRSASSHGSNSTAPFSISRKRFWISSSQACSASASISRSRLSSSESARAARPSGGRDNASFNSSAASFGTLQL